MITKPTIYTEEYVLNEVRSIFAEVCENKEIVYIGEVFEKRKYPRQNYSEWASKFKDNEEISDTIKAIDGMLESRVNTGGLKGKLNATMTIFNLKNNYGWKDQQEYRHSGGLAISELTNEQKKKIAAEFISNATPTDRPAGN